MALICCSNEKHGLFLLFFFNFVLRLGMCAGELESMCQHVVCFSFKAACRCSNEKLIHMQTRTHTHKTKILCVCLEYTQVNVVSYFCVYVFVSRWFQWHRHLGWSRTHCHSNKTHWTEMKTKKKLDRHRFNGVRSAAFPCVKCREILFQCETILCIVIR